MRRLLWTAVVGSMVALPAASEVFIELADESSAAIRERRVAPALSDEESLGLDRGVLFTEPPWFLPWEIDDTEPFGSQSLWAARNEREGSGDVELLVEYFDSFFQLIDSEMFTVGEDAVRSRNVRDVGTLIDPGEVSGGFVRISPDAPTSVDYFQVDAANDFATGGEAIVLDDFCSEWQVRFLRFPGDSSSLLRILVNGPRGSDPADDPTILGDVYDEGGNFINSFAVRTDEWLFVVEAESLVVGDVPFGSIELEIDAVSSPDGFVTVEHNAFGRFSVGLRGVCQEDELVL